jgi:hypothetical protein
MSLLQAISFLEVSVAKRENDYQGKLIKRIEKRFPDCFVMKNDEQYRAGTPDLTILHKDRWAVLEVKRNKSELKNPVPNQEHYVERLNGMGYSAFIYPENEAEVLDEVQRSFESGR